MLRGFLGFFLIADTHKPNKETVISEVHMVSVIQDHKGKQWK